ncbi:MULTISPECIES: hypothetical protein [Dermacoccus]|uniref:Uncharacterized protein n=2 Tax=Dermacoccus TaxID=57495 RepID=A0A417Z3W2_9MICO|nr:MULTISPECIES: hypothetical protein [Dermacoccus]QNK53282.1 hypothetical protein H7F30_02830 [Dermacoccus sp. PAMC28757]RHW44934.1 hypothetical protein D1832_10480 [Dermacoccus abyssi]
MVRDLVTYEIYKGFHRAANRMLTNLHKRHDGPSGQSPPDADRARVGIEVALCEIAGSLDAAVLYERACSLEALLVPRGWVTHWRNVLSETYSPFVVFAWHPSSPDDETSPTMIALVTNRDGLGNPALLVTLADRQDAPRFHRRLSSAEVEELDPLLDELEAYQAPPRPAGVPQGFQGGGPLLFTTARFMDDVHPPQSVG